MPISDTARKCWICPYRFLPSGLPLGNLSHPVRWLTPPQATEDAPAVEVQQQPTHRGARFMTAKKKSPKASTIEAKKAVVMNSGKRTRPPSSSPPWSSSPWPPAWASSCSRGRVTGDHGSQLTVGDPDPREGPFHLPGQPVRRRESPPFSICRHGKQDHHRLFHPEKYRWRHPGGL